MASENGSEAEDTQESDDTENDSQQRKSSSPETSTTSHSDSPCELCENSNLCGILIMKCPKCSWHDYYKICPICDHQIPEERNYIKEGFLRRGLINFHSFQIALYLILFVKLLIVFIIIREGVPLGFLL